MGGGGWLTLSKSLHHQENKMPENVGEESSPALATFGGDEKFS